MAVVKRGWAPPSANEIIDLTDRSTRIAAPIRADEAVRNDDPRFAAVAFDNRFTLFSLCDADVVKQALAGVDTLIAQARSSDLFTTLWNPATLSWVIAPAAWLLDLAFNYRTAGGADKFLQVKHGGTPGLPDGTTLTSYQFAPSDTAGAWAYGSSEGGADASADPQWPTALYKLVLAFGGGAGGGDSIELQALTGVMKTKGTP
jgi:hypothetical protein